MSVWHPTSRSLAGAAVALALVVTGVVVATRDDAPRERPGRAADATPVELASLPAYAGADWVEALQEEQDRFTGGSLVDDPWSLTGMSDFHGELVDVTDGVRRTVDAAELCDGCPVVRLWLVGGSSVFGLGQRDQGTIASELVRLGAADGVQLQVTNLGVPGWTSFQEWRRVQERLGSGAPLPDLVVFLDGFNDVVLTAIDVAVHGVRPDEPTLPDAAATAEVDRSRIDVSERSTPTEVGELAARRQRRVVDTARAGLAAFGVDAVFAFQPDALGAPGQLASIEPTTSLSPKAQRFFDDALEVARRELSPPAIDLRGLFDADPDPRFGDVVHTNEVGAALTAAALYDHVGPRVRELAGR